VKIEMLVFVVSFYQGSLAATFKAFNAQNINKATLEPVGASRLAQRRGKARPKSSTAL
jgi:p90 ribosomal S6 kinase